MGIPGLAPSGLRTPIVILFYNKRRLTERCIRSALDSGYASRAIFCLDNGSDEHVGNTLSREFPGVRFHRIEPNRGFSGGFNAALNWVFREGYSQAFFCTNDTILSSGVAEACDAVARETGARLVAPCVRFDRQPEKIDAAGAWFSPEAFWLYHYRETGLPVMMDAEYDYIPGTALWVHKEPFFTLDGMDESFFTYWEDVDFCLRARKRGFTMARAYSAVIYHLVGRTCHKKPEYTTYYFHRNRLLFCRKHLPEKEWKQAAMRVARDILKMEKMEDSAGKNGGKKIWIQRLKREFEKMTNVSAETMTEDLNDDTD